MNRLSLCLCSAGVVAAAVCGSVQARGLMRGMALRPNMARPIPEGALREAGAFRENPHAGDFREGGLRDGAPREGMMRPAVQSGANFQQPIRPPMVTPNQMNAIRSHFQQNYSARDYGSRDWNQRHPNAWHLPDADPGPKPAPQPGPHPQPNPRPQPIPPPHPYPPAPDYPHGWWVPPPWNDVWFWFGVRTIPTAVVYDYGNSVVYSGDTVYINGVPYVTADEYYNQAKTLAKTEAPTDNTNDDKAPWLPMGTFSVVGAATQNQSEQVLQLATDSKGRIRGNLINQTDDSVITLAGNVDPKTQRVAFTLSGYDDVVAECGLWNLTQDTLTMLVHLNKDKTEELTLIRLKKDTPPPAVN